MPSEAGKTLLDVARIFTNHRQCTSNVFAYFLSALLFNQQSELHQSSLQRQLIYVHPFKHVW